MYQKRLSAWQVSDTASKEPSLEEKVDNTTSGRVQDLKGNSKSKCKKSSTKTAKPDVETATADVNASDLPGPLIDGERST